MRTACEVDRSHEVDLVELIGGPGLGSGVLLAWQQRAERTRGTVKPLRCNTRSMVRGQGSGWTFRVFNSARMALTPIRL